MAKITNPASKLEGAKPLPPGVYEFRLDGFEPQWSKDKGSVNLRPVMRVVNHPTENDHRIFDNLNSRAAWVHKDFCHALGVELETAVGDDGEPVVTLPGDFVGPDDDPTKWNYVGPLLGRIGRCLVVEVDNNSGGKRSQIKQYYCQVAGCQQKHSADLT